MKQLFLHLFFFFLTYHAFAQPTVNLGPNTFACDSYTLDAGNAGATYLWSTNETAQTIVVSTSGTYWVDVTDVSGTTRDSIDVEVLLTPNSPTVNDTMVCSEMVSLSIPTMGSQITWWDAPTSGALLAIGNTYPFDATSNTTFYLEARNLFDQGQVGQDPDFNDLSFSSNTIGLKFDVYKPMVLNSVLLYPNAVVNTTIELRNDQGTLIHSKTVTLDKVGEKNYVSLDFDISAGNDYTIICTNTSGGGLGRKTGGANYPYTFSDYVSIQSVSTGNTNNFFYLFDWHVSQAFCASSRIPYNVDVFDYPTVNLGTDTSLCNVPSYTLDAQNPGATYIWNTGSTAQSINVSNTGTYAVTATNNGLCSVMDDIELTFLQTPPTPSFNNLFLCSPEEIILQAPSQFYNVYDSPAATVPIASGQEITLYPASSTTYYVEGAAQDNFTTGPDQVIGFTPSDYANFIISTIFDVNEFVILDSIAVYVDGPTSFDIILTDDLGNPLETKSFSLATPDTKTFLPLNFSVPPGSNYYLKFENIAGGKLVKGSPSTYPYNSVNGLVSITGNSISSSTTYYFYDWHFSTGLQSCVTPRVPYNITVNHAFDLADSIFVCNPTVLDATSAGASYLWSTGATSPTIVASTPGVYTVEVSDATCTAYDTIIVDMPTPVGLAPDGILCGSTLSTNYTGTGSTFMWSTGQVSSTIEIMMPGTYSVAIAEPGGCFLLDTIVVTGIEALPTVNLGNPIDTFCMSTSLDAGNPGYTYLWNTGATSQMLNVTNDGMYEVTVTSPNGCSSSDAIDITLESAPISDFTYVATGNSVEFTNLSSPGDYLWNMGDGFMTDYFDPTYLYANSGVYTVTLTTTNSCGSDTYTEVINVLVSIEDLQNQLDINVYPNPAKDVLYLEFSESIQDLSLEILDLNGRQLYTISKEQGLANTNMQIPLQTFNSGLYILKLQIANEHFYDKIFIQK